MKEDWERLRKTEFSIWYKTEVNKPLEDRSTEMLFGNWTSHNIA